MADEDDKPKKHTLESLFHLYCNYAVILVDLDNVDYDCILLSQIDYWLDQAKLLKTTFTLTETGLTYMKFRYKIFTYIHMYIPVKYKLKCIGSL